jgi:hypothetical protein
MSKVSYPCHIQNASVRMTVRQCNECRREHGCAKYKLAIRELIREWVI